MIYCFKSTYMLAFCACSVPFIQHLVCVWDIGQKKDACTTRAHWDITKTHTLFWQEHHLFTKKEMDIFGSHFEWNTAYTWLVSSSGLTCPGTGILWVQGTVIRPSCIWRGSASLSSKPWPSKVTNMLSPSTTCIGTSTWNCTPNSV